MLHQIVTLGIAVQHGTMRQTDTNLCCKNKKANKQKASVLKTKGVSINFINVHNETPKTILLIREKKGSE